MQRVRDLVDWMSIEEALKQSRRTSGYQGRYLAQLDAIRLQVRRSNREQPGQARDAADKPTREEQRRVDEHENVLGDPPGISLMIFLCIPGCWVSSIAWLSILGQFLARLGGPGTRARYCR